MKLDIIYRYEARERPRPQPADSAAALRRLRDGNQAFAALFDAASHDQNRAQVVVQLDPGDVGLASSNSNLPKQRAYAAVLGCADARVPIELIFNEGPNDLFVLRVAGNGLGPEVLGSLNYAVNCLGDSLRLIVVLGHSGCGAITKAVEVFLEPAKYLSLAKQHSLRGIIDHLLGVVQASSRRLLTAFGTEVAHHPAFPQALTEASIVTNAALTAYTIEQELGVFDKTRLRVVFGVYRIESREIWAPGGGHPDRIGLALPPEDEGQFAEFSDAVIRSARIRTLLTAVG
jgi:carbonic anhydrase